MRRLPRAPPRLGRGSGAVLARARRGPRARVLAAVGARARRVAGPRVGTLVRRRAAEPRAELRPPLGREDACGAGGDLPRRGRRAAGADVGRAVAGGDTAPPGAPWARGGAPR